ncbi:MAG: acetylglutamate kinase [Firmicutes bacterium]|nr:acetylglutamate kinase [Bacillota bacterium]
MATATEKAGILIEALPYIRTFYGKTFVIKYGGHAMLDPQLRKAVLLDIVLLRYIGVRPVVVHGGGTEISEMLRRIGKEPTFVQGLRVTDAETMEIVQMVLVGKINHELVAQINAQGAKAVGLSGKDGNLFVAEKYTAGGVDLGFVGEIKAVHPELVVNLTDQGYIPVIAPVAVGPDGESYNINADTAAGELAAALGAEKLIMLTDVEGIMLDPKDPATLLSTLAVEQAYALIGEGRIDGGMIPKVEACVKALRQGVARTHIIDGRQLHSLLLEIFTDRGTGTMIVA